MAKLVECRDIETGSHIKRLQTYCRRLAEEAADLPAFADDIDADFIRWLEWCAPFTTSARQAFRTPSYKSPAR